MPANYAHYRFGVEMLAQMPGDIRRTVKRFRQLYDVGLHGPDIFAYYNPVINTKVGALSGKYHHQTGADFFQRVCRNLRLDPSEAALSYLYGLLTHYCLDTVCHPLVHQMHDEGVAIHKEIETEFDRWLMEADGKVPPCTYDLTPHIRLTPGECATVARFYPGANATNIRDCVRNMAYLTRLMAVPDGKKRELLKKALGVTAYRMIPTAPNPKCAHLDEQLMALYQSAVEQFPTFLLQLNAHLTYNAPLGQEFAPEFG